MVARIETAVVSLWGQQVGAVSWLDSPGYGVFEFDPAFLKRGLDISPLHMGLEAARSGDGIFSFPGLSRETYLGLPGLLADALPDKYGNSVIDAWLARQGRDPAGFSPIERLCYTGRRGMGALEFSPPVNRPLENAVPVQVSELVALAQDIMAQRQRLSVELGDSDRQNAEAIMDILRVGTSAGGARPKAVIAMDGQGNVLSGQAEVPAGFDFWLLKFDGVEDLELGEPKGFGRIEFAYYLMARAAGIEMSESRLLEENGRAHFLTRRFDRLRHPVDGQESPPAFHVKQHMQTLCGIAHFDFNQAGAYSYEQLFAVMRRLRLSKAEAIQQFRRMVFNVIARNQDDHTKNVAFLMDGEGRWRLSPAFDVIYSHNPAGRWTSQHQMSINGKRDRFTLQDLVTVGESISLKRPRVVIEEIADVVSRWPEFARRADVPERDVVEIGRHHRLGIVAR